MTQISVKPLSEQGVLIVGGTSGIGLACARRLIGEGARVCLIGRHTGRGRDAVAALGTHATFWRADVSDIAGLEDTFAEIAAHLGAIDTMICSVGGSRLPDLLFRWSLEEIRDTVSRDLAPFLYCGRAVLPHMMAQNGGTVINVASDAGKLATPGEAVIGAGMAAIIQFTRGLAIEGKRNGIRANTLTPSLVEGTPLTERLMEEGLFSAKLFAKARPMAHLGPTLPEDLAEMAAFLASPAAAKITGQAISINGGISAA